MKPVTTYNDADHSYYLAGVRVPSVTQILSDLLPCWQASEWHLQRGRAVHACAALIANGRPFTCDPQIAGQVAACERWFAEVKPEVLDAEQIVTSLRYRYCGRYDLFATINGKDMIVDWKASLAASVPYQLTAYGVAADFVRYGVAVELHEDGTYRMSDVYDLRRYRAEWLAMRAVYGIRQRLGKTEKGDKQ